MLKQHMWMKTSDPGEHRLHQRIHIQEENVYTVLATFNPCASNLQPLSMGKSLRPVPGTKPSQAQARNWFWAMRKD
jgi:hypothetical protein